MGELYDRVCNWNNLLTAWRQAAQGKRRREPAVRFEHRLEDNLVWLQTDLQEKTYRPGAYVSFYIHEPKRRLISAAPFRDRVVHHALCNVIEPIFERSFISDSYANRRGKGTHRALDRCQELARRYRYVLQCDVRQFFPSIDHTILRDTLARKIADADVLWLIDQILAGGAGVLREEYQMVYFPGDDLWAVLRPRGLPIGNLTSQFWANCYLNPFDHFVKRELRCSKPRGDYVRYVDDMLLFSDDKSRLWDWRRAILERMARLRLTIHEECAHPYPTETGIPWLGFRIWSTHRRLKSRTGLAYRRRLKWLLAGCARGQVSRDQVDASVRGWINHARHGDTWGLRRAMFAGLVIPARRNDGGRDAGDRPHL